MSHYIVNGQTLSAENIQSSTVAHNATGLPALSMRFGTSRETASPVRDLHPQI